MAKAVTVYVCGSCGGDSPKWQGQCPHCGEWNTLTRMSGLRPAGRAAGVPTGAPGAALPGVSVALAGGAPQAVRVATGLAELDRVLGGGLTCGSVTLIGGEPGIGKSTLLLQVAAGIAADAPVVYASGEESTEQVAARAARLGLAAGALTLACEYRLEAILELAVARRATLLVIDSIQTMQSSVADASPGSAQQLRESTAALVRHAKASGTAVFIVGHVTKEGSIAGPKLLEHLVDAVLYFDAEAGSRYRMLRATKNRFGAVNELGFFLMDEQGLREVRNPSAIFVARAGAPVAGSVVMVAREGGRPLLVEVQALVDRTRFAAPRRVAQGVDGNRLAMLLAVMSRHAGVPLAEHDAYVNLVGGLRVAETGTDLPVALALASSLRDAPLGERLAVFGELGLTGEVRPVVHGEERLRELVRQGYATAILPRQNAPKGGVPGLELRPVATLAEALAAAFGR